MSRYRFSYLPLIITSLLLFLFLSGTPLGHAQEDTGGAFIRFASDAPGKPPLAASDELLVKYSNNATARDKRDVRNQNDLSQERVSVNPLRENNSEIVNLSDYVTAEELGEAIDKLEQNFSVEYAEPNYVMEIQAESEVAPDDTDYAREWPFPKTHTFDFWSKTTGISRTVIAVLDTGLDYSHPDKPRNLISGYDFINNDTDPQDDHGHGTFIAGVIAGNTNNGEGIAGICYTCSIMPVKVMDSRGIGTYADVSKGIIWAADHGADIINLSIGGYAYSQTLQDAVSYAQEKGVLIIAAGGNQGLSDPLYPAAFANVIGVSATDKEDSRWTRSNYGDSIDLSAPGVNVYGLFLNNSYRSQTGTSVSAAHVAGIAGLFLSEDPALTNNAITQKLYDSSEDLGSPGRDVYYGYGRVDTGFIISASPEQSVRPDEISDAGTTISESHITGNQESASSDIHDLAVTSIKIDPPTFKSGEETKIIVSVQNQGTVEEKEIFLKIFVNDVQIGTDQAIDLISPEAIRSIQLSWKPEVGSNEQLQLAIKAEVNLLINEKEADDNFLINSLLARNENGTVTIQHAQEVHQWIVNQAIDYLGEKGQADSHLKEIYDELVAYKKQFIQAAWDEDNSVIGCIESFGKGDCTKDDVKARWFRHFYRPMDESGFNDPILGSYPNSYEWGSGKYPEFATQNSYDWEDARREYANENKSSAYYALGHVLHLIMDASVPEHTHLESHIPTEPKGYEKYAKYLHENYPNLEIFEGECKRYIEEGQTKGETRNCRDLITDQNAQKLYKYYEDALRNFSLLPNTNLKDYFDQLSRIAYYSNRFQAELNQEGLYPAGSDIPSRTERAFGELKDKIFPDLYYHDGIWTIPNVGDWNQSIKENVADEWWQTKAFKNNVNESPGWYYIENGFGDWPSRAIPAQYRSEWRQYVREELAKPKNDQFKIPYHISHPDGYVTNTEGKIFAETFAEDLIPYAIQYTASAMVKFYEDTHTSAPTPPLAPVIKAPDIELVKDSFFRFTQTKRIFSGYRYDVRITVKNIGNAPVDNGILCFTSDLLPELVSSCKGNDGIIGSLEPGKSTVVSFYFETKVLPLLGDTLGIVQIKKDTVSPPKELSIANNKVKVYQSDLADLGGVDLTSAALTGLSVDPDGGSVRFLIKGTAAKEREPAIDLGETKAELNKVFLQALAVPNSKHAISLDIVPDGDARKGQARIEEPFQNTDMADAMLKADVGMKFDLFGNGHLNGTTEWTRLIKASPYYTELWQKGFNREPDYVIAATIVPGNIEGKQTGNDFFLENVRLDINAGWWMRPPTIDLDGLNLSAGARADVLQRVEDYKKFIEYTVKARAGTFTVPELNRDDPNADPRFKRLRTIYSAISAAQWYKEQVKKNPSLPYAYLVDSENLAGIGLDTPFDRAYWDGQAYQNLGSFDCDTLEGAGECSMMGGLDLQNSKAAINGSLTASQADFLGKAAKQMQVVEEGDTRYLGSAVETDGPDLTVGGVEVGASDQGATSALRLRMGDAITIQTTLSNQGPAASGGFKLKLQDEVTLPNNRKTVYLIEERAVDGMTEGQDRTESFEWTLPEVAGTHRILATVDPAGQVREMSEANNVSWATLTAVDPKPEITLISPDAASVLHPNNIVLEAYALDPLTEETMESDRFTWSSSLQGALGNGSKLTLPALQEGDHQITLTVTANGVTTNKIFNLYIRPLGSPLPKIRFPVNEGHLSEELTYTFRGEAVDNEDGRLTGSSLTWASDKDGVLGTGETISVQLSPGTHKLSLTAKDRDGQSSASTITVTAEKGTPTLSVASPEEGAVIWKGSEITFSGTADDPQEGDIGSRILWSSDKDGVLDQTSDFSRVLSAGPHRITATVIDSDGLKATAERGIFIMNQNPVATITAPEDWTRISFGDPVTLEGSAEDAQDGPISDDQLVWTSDRDGYLGAGPTLTVSSLSPGQHEIKLIATDLDGAIGVASVHIESYTGAPAVRIVSPAAEQTFKAGTTITLEGSALDTEDGDLSDSLRWTSDYDGALGTEQTLELSNLSVGTHTLRAEVEDNDGWKGSATVVITVRGREAPVTAILFPREGSSFAFGKSVYFYGSGTDAEDGTLAGDSLVWISNVDGELGRGATVKREALSVGEHTLTLAATDSDGTRTVNTAHFTITPLPPTVVIDSLAENLVVPVGTAVTLSGHGADELSWGSGLQGELGAGTSLTVSNLSVGIHPITLTGTQNGLTGTAKITVTVVDEKSLSVTAFTDGQSTELLDFGTQQDYTLNLALPKEAVIDQAQLTLHAQRGRDTLGTQSVMSEPEGPLDEEKPVLYQPYIPPENKPPWEMMDPVREFLETRPNESVDELSVQSATVQILDFAMGTAFDTAWPYAPLDRRNGFLPTESSGFWIQWNSNTEGYLGYEFYWVDPATGEERLAHSNMEAGETGTAFAAGTTVYTLWSGSTDEGLYRWKIYFRSSGSDAWDYRMSYDFSIRTTAGINPDVGVYIDLFNNSSEPARGFYEDHLISLYPEGTDDGDIAETAIYWNDGTGWQSQRTREHISNTTGSFQSEYNKGFVPFSLKEDITVQYYATATDYEGNVGQSETSSFTILDTDTTGPEITNFSMMEGDGADQDGFVDDTESVRITWSANEPVETNCLLGGQGSCYTNPSSGIVKEIQFVLDGAPQTLIVEGENYTLDLPPLSAGDHAYTLTATDGDDSPAITTVEGMLTVIHRPLLLNPSLDLGADGSVEWRYEGEMTDDQVIATLAEWLRVYLAALPAEADGRVTVPMRLHADQGFFMKAHQLFVGYRILDTILPTIGEITMSPETLLSGQPVQIRVTATDNTSVERVTATFNEGSIDQSSLLIFENGVFTGTLTAPAAGAHDLTVTATDAGGLISTKTVPLHVVFNGPELFIESVTFDPEEPLLAGKSVTANIVVRNTGNADAVAVSVETIHELSLRNTQTATVPANDATTVAIPFTLPAPGEHEFRVTVDSDNTAAEENENNNVFIQNYTTVDADAPVFASVELPAVVGAGQPFTVRAEVSDNVGVAGVSAEWNGGMVETIHELSLPNAPYTATITAPAELGDRPLILTVRDTSGLTTSVQRTVSVIDARPNLRIRAEDIVSATDNILARERPVFRITIENTGGADAENAALAIGVGETTPQTISIPAGGQTTIAWSDWEAVAGSHVLTITLDPNNAVDETDETDNMTSYAFTVPYTLPPQITDLQIPNNVLEGQIAEISVMVGADQELESVTMEIDGRVVGMDRVGPRDLAALQMPVGIYPFTITAINISGLMARMPGTLTVHSALPDLTADVPAVTPVVLTNADTAEFAITIKNNGFVDATDVPVTVWLDGNVVQATAVTVETIHELSLLPKIPWAPTPGLHTLTVTVDPDNTVMETDETNNTATLAFRVGNVVAPRLTNVTAKTTVYAGESFDITADVADTVPVTVAVTLGGRDVINHVSTENRFTATIPAPAAPGDHALRLTARNEDGLTAAWEQTVTVLDGRPDLRISPADVVIAPRTLNEGTPETITATIYNDGGTDAENVAVALDRRDVINHVSTNTRTATIPRGGKTTVSWPWDPAFGAQDLSIAVDPDNVIEESNETNNAYRLSLYVNDTTPPGSPVLTAEAQVQTDTWTETKNWNVRWGDVTETNLAGYEWNENGNAFADLGNTSHLDLIFEQAGEHAVCVRARDRAGNLSAESCVTIRTDYAAPGAPTVYGTGASSWSPDNRLAVSWNAPEDDGSGVARYLMNVDGDISETTDTRYERVWEDGRHTVSVAAVDHAGHQGGWSAPLTLLVDASAPEKITMAASSTHPDPEKWYRHATPSFEWGVPRDLSGVSGYNYYIDRNPLTTPANQHLWTADNRLEIAPENALKSGMWYLHLAPVDRAGNQGETTHVKFQIDLSPPRTEISAEGDAGESVSLSSSDDWSPVAQTFFRADGRAWEQGASIYAPSFGKHTIEFYSVDAAGNEEPVRSAEVNFQTTGSRRQRRVDFIEEEPVIVPVETIHELSLQDTPPLPEPLSSPESFSDSFDNITIYARRLFNLISWNNGNSRAVSFIIYRRSTEADEWQEAGKITRVPGRRTRFVDWGAPATAQYYLAGADASGKVIEKTENPLRVRGIIKLSRQPPHSLTFQGK